MSENKKLAKLKRNDSNQLTLEGRMVKVYPCKPAIVCTGSQRYHKISDEEYKELVEKAIQLKGTELNAEAYEYGETIPGGIASDGWFWHLYGVPPFEIHGVQFYKLLGGKV